MRKPYWSSRLIWRYALLQLPGILIVLIVFLLAEAWLGLPMWIGWVGVMVWIAKDIALFPFVWRAYDWDGLAGNEHSMVGRRGVVKERLSPFGYVQIGNELWRAEVVAGAAAIAEGSVVRVRAVQGLTLIVEPENTP